MWIQITDEQAEAVTKLMSSESLGYSYDLPEEVVAELRALAKKIREAQVDTKNPVLQAYVAKAKEQRYRESDYEIDNDAVVSPGSDPGAYVMAWVWVPDDKKERDACPGNFWLRLKEDEDADEEE